MKSRPIAVLVAALTVAFPVNADEQVHLTFAGDHFAAGQVTNLVAPIEHDAFAVGNDVTLSTIVAGDAHFLGYDVDVRSGVTGDLYAAGFSVNVAGSIGGDLTVFGNTVNVTSASTIAGNARLAGSSVTLAAPVSGSAMVTAETFTLDVPVTGDLSFYGENLNFGPGARVDGRLDIRAPSEIAVPPTVASADRVHFAAFEAPDYVSEASKTAGGVVGRFWPAFWTVAIWWFALLVLGTGLIALMPRAVVAVERGAERRPFRNLGLGVLAFAAVLGLVPVIGMTLVGLLLVPFVLVFVVIACSLAYLVGTYVIGTRIAKAFTPMNSNLKRVFILAVSLISAALLGIIPLLGWLITLAFIVFGFGTATLAILARWSAEEASRPHEVEQVSGVVA